MKLKMIAALAALVVGANAHAGATPEAHLALNKTMDGLVASCKEAGGSQYAGYGLFMMDAKENERLQNLRRTKEKELGWDWRERFTKESTEFGNDAWCLLKDGRLILAIGYTDSKKVCQQIGDSKPECRPIQ